MSSNLPYDHKGISRLRAEELLLKSPDDGRFLIRDSETVKGAHVLCVLFQGRIHQYRILPDAGGKLSVQAEEGVQERKFNTLAELIEDYLSPHNGLVCSLKYPVFVEISEECDRDTDDEIDSNVKQYSSHEAILSQYRDRLQHLLPISSGCGLEFIDSLKAYIDSGLRSDLESVQNGGIQLTQLRQILATHMDDFQRQLVLFLQRLDLSRALLDQNVNLPNNRNSLYQQLDNQKMDFDSFLDRLAQCKTSTAALESKLVKVFQEIGQSSRNDLSQLELQDTRTVPLLTPVHKPKIPVTSFKVKMESSMPLKMHQKATLTVDVSAGRLFAVKDSKDVLDTSNTFRHERVLQLIKSKTNNCKLGVKIEGRKKDIYIFKDARARENFCQLVQQMKNMHSASTEIDQISIFVGTWNMGGASLPSNISSWLTSQGSGKTRDPPFDLMPHDLYVIGTQESSLSDKDWINKLKATLRETVIIEFLTVCVCSLWGIRLVVLVHPDHRHRISHVQQATVRTGIANALGNKGAVGVSFYFSGTSLCFINSHLTSGSEKCSRRNQNYRDILKCLNLGSKQLSMFDLTKQFHHLFWFGDLNYRTEGEPQETLLKVEQLKASETKDYSSLLHSDQLKNAINNKEAFCLFDEEDITFPPTYRYEKGNRKVYVWQKVKKSGVRINLPSWCDRVLHTSYPCTYIKCTSYGCADNIMTSDHSPVFATFDVGIITQFVSTRKPESDQVHIIFESIATEIKTRCKASFVLEFHSSCIEASVQGLANVYFNNSKEGYCCPSWASHQLPKLIPICPERSYLEDQHILITVRPVDSDEYYGECVLALKYMFSITPQQFDSYLTHMGEITGTLSGKMHVRCLGSTGASKLIRTSRKSYDLISVERDDLEETFMDNAEILENTPASSRKSGSTKSNTVEYHSSNICHPDPAIAKERCVSAVFESMYTNDEVLPLAPPRTGQPSLGVNARLMSRSHNKFSSGESCRLSWENKTSSTASSPEAISNGVECVNRGTQTTTSMYEQLQRPRSILDWLQKLRLVQYEQPFIQSGWDHIEFIEGISETDLIDMGIINSDHRLRILQSIQDMRS